MSASMSCREACTAYVASVAILIARRYAPLSRAEESEVEGAFWASKSHLVCVNEIVGRRHANDLIEAALLKLHR